MQTVRSYFYPNQILAQLVGIGNIGQNEECVVYSTPISLFAGVFNPIKIQCLNSDQKRIDVSNVSIAVSLFPAGGQYDLATVVGTGVDTANGVIEAVFTPSNLAPLDYGFYDLAVTATDQNGNIYPVYIDDNYGTRLQTSLAKGPVLAYANPIDFNFVDSTGQGVISSQINATARPMGSTTATACINLVAYTGNVWSQGSMVTTPTQNDWANISAVYYSNVSGPVFQNVLGSYAWLRFTLPDADPRGWGNVTVNNFVTGGNIRL